MLLYVIIQTVIVIRQVFIAQSIVPGPPFAIGSVLGIMALIVAAFMPENPAGSLRKSALFPSSVQSSTDHSRCLYLLISLRMFSHSCLLSQCALL